MFRPNAAADAAAEPADARRPDDPRLGAYQAERAAAQAKLIAASMDLRRFGAAPTDCDGDYEVLERWS
jgi:hypothetical protein